MAEQPEDQEAGARRTPRWVTAAAFLLLMAFLALLAGGLGRSQQGPLSVGEAVSTFALATFDGKTIATADLRGSVVLVNFWASWCSPCGDEAPALETAWRSYRGRGDVVFLGVDYADTEPEALQFLDKYAVTYPNGPDLRSEISALFRIRGVPETYIIDRQGNLAFIRKGPFASAPDIQFVLDGLLEQE